MDRKELKAKRLELLEKIDKRMALGLPVEEYGEQLLELTSERVIVPIVKTSELKPHEGKAVLIESMEYIAKERMKFRDWSVISIDLGINSWVMRDHLNRWLKRELVKKYPESAIYVNHRGKIKHLYVKMSKQKIVKMYENGSKVEEISAVLDINISTLREILREGNCKK